MVTGVDTIHVSKHADDRQVRERRKMEIGAVEAHVEHPAGKDFQVSSQVL
jgi:hypothetical protein